MPAKKTAKKMTKPTKATKGKAKKTTRAPKIKREMPEVEGHALTSAVSSVSAVNTASAENKQVYS